MILLKEELDKRYNHYNQYELNNQRLMEVWTFYSLYDCCLAVIRSIDPYFKKKNLLIQKMINNPEDIKSYNKLKSFMLKDIEVINLAMEKLENRNDGGVQQGDYKKPTMFAISIND